MIPKTNLLESNLVKKNTLGRFAINFDDQLNSEVENLFIRLTIVSENEVILMNVSGVLTNHYEYNYVYNIYSILKPSRLSLQPTL